MIGSTFPSDEEAMGVGGDGKQGDKVGGLRVDLMPWTAAQPFVEGRCAARAPCPLPRALYEATICSSLSINTYTREECDKNLTEVEYFSIRKLGPGACEMPRKASVLK